MRLKVAVLLACLLFLLSIAPWILSSCSSQPLLPDELKQERAHYEETVNAARTQTMEAQRVLTSTVKVISLGTVAPGEGTALAPATVEPMATVSAPTLAPIPSGTPDMVSTSVPPEPSNPTRESESVVVVGTAVITQTPQATRKIIIVYSNSTPDSPDSPTSPGSSASPVPTQQMTEIEDIITEMMLIEQIQRDAGDVSISDLTISMTPAGVIATGNVSILPGIERPIKTTGTFVVENDNLVVKVTSILFDDMDVTDLYSTQLEDNINWSLYQLLPQRYVKSYTLLHDKIVVRSQVRP